ncbi:orotidine-5'-phosphate decarboxylase [Rossellomorea marisflavi]|uniref:orotidine-5'-phosphate decarboxylase n=1 Tax=Rossellomorea marisflavi TaxID=189381 RepID=UPI00064E397B|nr:orotidine-5'-phosphate decarboxylase [Rossellomorea marisflavi]KML32774.1 orotidine 5'-phosphate decarboxylase [Rossellomorea marisflavi]
MNKPFIALDFPTWEVTEAFLSQFDERLNVKVGMELYLQNGPRIIESLLKKDHRIFLDLKLHDIPNTVFGAMKGLGQWDLEFINVHAAGGKEMMERAMEAIQSQGGKTKLIAVTQLTSTSEHQMQSEQLIPNPLTESVIHYARLAQGAGLQGVVCSPHEAGLIREYCGEEFLRVTPGIRMKSDGTDDQQRITSPGNARELGSTHIVVGRSITKAADPVAAYRMICQDWEGSIYEKTNC